MRGCGLTDGLIAVDRLIEAAGPFPKRNIRVRLNQRVPTLLAVDGLTVPARICDISQHGAALALEQRLPVGCQVRIVGGHLPVLHARVRWRHDCLHGLAFQQGFRFDVLAELAVRIRPEPNGAPDQSQPFKIGAALTGD